MLSMKYKPLETKQGCCSQKSILLHRHSLCIQSLTGPRNNATDAKPLMSSNIVFAGGLNPPYLLMSHRTYTSIMSNSAERVDAQKYNRVFKCCKSVLPTTQKIRKMEHSYIYKKHGQVKSGATRTSMDLKSLLSGNELHILQLYWKVCTTLRRHKQQRTYKCQMQKTRKLRSDTEQS